MIFRKCCEEIFICDDCEKFVRRLNKHDDVIKWNLMKIAPPRNEELVEPLYRANLVVIITPPTI